MAAPVNGCTGVLCGDKGIAFVLQSSAFAGLFADFWQFAGGGLEAPSPVDGRHAPGKIRHAAVGA
jgi:hypothetical protein